MKSGVDTSKKRFLKDELIDLCSRHNIPTSFQKVKVVKGWNNSPKGMLQMLYERGCINIELVTKFFITDGLKINKNMNGPTTVPSPF